MPDGNTERLLGQVCISRLRRIRILAAGAVVLYATTLAPTPLGAGLGQSPETALTVAPDELVEAAKANDVVRVRQLLDSGLSVEARSAARGKPPLIVEAASSGAADVVELLLQKGADPDAATEFGNTALFHAAMYGHAETLGVLLRFGADVNARSKSGETALDVVHTDVWCHERSKVVPMLLKHGAVLTGTDPFAMRPMLGMATGAGYTSPMGPSISIGVVVGAQRKACGGGPVEKEAFGLLLQSEFADGARRYAFGFHVTEGKAYLFPAWDLGLNIALLRLNDYRLPNQERVDLRYAGPEAQFVVGWMRVRIGYLFLLGRDTPGFAGGNRFTWSLGAGL